MRSRPAEPRGGRPRRRGDRSAAPGGGRHRPPQASERGSVTAETALALPAVVLVLATLLGTGEVMLARVSCVDAARAGARAAARAEPDARVRSLVAALDPSATSGVRYGAGVVRVEVAQAVPLALPVPPVEVRCFAVAALEAAP